MRELILGVASVSVAVFAAVPASDAFAYSRFFPEELDPIWVSSHEPQQSD